MAKMKKVTVENLEKSTAQQVFDYISNHLLTQNKRSVKGSVCRYRCEDGSSCAAGILFTDKSYKESFEGKKWTLLASRKVVPSKHLLLIDKLQNIHDSIGVLNWKENLRKVAKEYDLKTTVLDQF